MPSTIRGGDNFDSGQRLTSTASQSSTSGTSVDFTGIPNWAKRITVVFNGVQMASTGVYLRLQLGTSGGITSSGYSSAAADSGGSNTATTGFTLNQGSGATYLWSGNVTLVNIGGNTWIESGLIGAISPGTNISYSTGSVSLASAIATVRLTTSTGSTAFTAGSVSIIYE